MIGLEIHVQLKSDNKVFSKSLNNYDCGVNENINNVDVGEPGSLPTVDPQVIILARRVAKILMCKNVSKTVSFLRKTYFYNDLPKGFQLTQLENSIGLNGWIYIPIFNAKNHWCSNRKIIIDRVQIEEDTAQKKYANNELQLNFNRSGVPLVEIVTATSFVDFTDVITFLKILRFLLKKIGISQCRFEKGEIRCDVNISINTELFKGPRTEIKNLNSFVNIRKAIIQEKNLLTDLYKNSEKIVSTTKKFSELNQQLVVMRTKMAKSSYLFSYEPNLPVINLTSLPIKEQKFDQSIKDVQSCYMDVINCHIFFDYYAIIFENENSNVFNLLLKSSWLISSDYIQFIIKRIINQTSNIIKVKDKIFLLYQWMNNNNTECIPDSVINQLIGKFLCNKMVLSELGIWINKYKKNILTEKEIKSKILFLIKQKKNSLISNNEEKIINILLGLFMKENSSRINNPKKVRKMISILLNEDNKNNY